MPQFVKPDLSKERASARLRVLDESVNLGTNRYIHQYNPETDNIVDGDTLGRNRLVGFDTPESAQSSNNEKAKELLYSGVSLADQKRLGLAGKHELVKQLQQYPDMLFSKLGVDSFGRTLLSNESLTDAMVASGTAVPTDRYDAKRQAMFRARQEKLQNINPNDASIMEEVRQRNIERQNPGFLGTIKNIPSALAAGTQELVAGVGDAVLDVLTPGGNNTLLDKAKSGEAAREAWGYDGREAQFRGAEAVSNVHQGRYLQAASDVLHVAPEALAESAPTIASYAVGVGEAKALLVGAKIAKAVGTSGRAADVVSKIAAAPLKALGFEAAVFGQTNNDIDEFTKNNKGVEPTASRVATMTASNFATMALDKYVDFKILKGTDLSTTMDALAAAVKILPEKAMIQIGKKVATNAAKLVVTAGEEGAQEYVQQWGQILNQKLGTTKYGDLNSLLSNREVMDEALGAGLMGAGMGTGMKAVSQAAQIVGAIPTTIDKFRTRAPGMSANEIREVELAGGIPTNDVGYTQQANEYTNTFKTAMQSNDMPTAKTSIDDYLATTQARMEAGELEAGSPEYIDTRTKLTEMYGEYYKKAQNIVTPEFQAASRDYKRYKEDPTTPPDILGSSRESLGRNIQDIIDSGTSLEETDIVEMETLAKDLGIDTTQYKIEQEAIAPFKALDSKSVNQVTYESLIGENGVQRVYEKMKAAVKAGDTDTANQMLGKLQHFKDTQVSKLQKLEEGLVQYKSNPKESVVVPYSVDGKSKFTIGVHGDVRTPNHAINATTAVVGEVSKTIEALDKVLEAVEVKVPKAEKPEVIKQNKPKEVEAPTEVKTKVSSKFQGKVVLGNSGVGKSFAKSKFDNIVDGDDLFLKAANTILAKYGESAHAIKSVKDMRSVFDFWGEYSKDVKRVEIAKRKRDEVYEQYAKYAKEEAATGKTVLSSSARGPLLDIADYVIIQGDANTIAGNRASGLRENKEDYDLAKAKEKIESFRSKTKGIINKLELSDGQYISDVLAKEEPTEAEVKAKAKEAREVIRKKEVVQAKKNILKEAISKIGIKAKTVQFKAKDKAYIQDLGEVVGSQVELNDDVLESMSIALLNWLAQDAENTLKVTEKDIKRMLKIKGDKVSPAQLKMMMGKGVFRKNVVQSLGSEVMKELGLELPVDVGYNVKQSIVTGLGNTLLAYMRDQGMITTLEISADEWNKANKLEGSDRVSKAIPMVQFNYDAIAEVKDAKRILKEDPELRYKDQQDKGPQYGKATSRKKHEFRNRTGKISNKDEERLSAQDKIEHNVKDNVYKAFKALGEYGKIAAGWKEVSKSLHTTTRQAIQAVNNSIERSLEHLENHIENAEDKMYSFNYFMSGNGRDMIDSNTFNPQSDKIHRHMDYTGKPTNPLVDERHEYLFKMAVMQGLKIDVDKMTKEALENEWNRLEKDETILGYAESLAEGKIDPVLAKEIAEYAGSKAKIHTLDSLVALGDYVKAKKNGTPILTTLQLEVDAVTSGWILALLQNPMFDMQTIKEYLAKGGVYLDDMDADYQARVEAKELDSYETVMKAVQEEMKGMKIPEESTNILKVDRKFAKGPFMTNVTYGAGIAGVKADIVDQYIQNLYDKMAEGTDGIRDVLRALKGLKVPHVVIKDSTEFMFDTKTYTAIEKAINDTYGKAVENALSSKYKAFIDVRNTTNKAFEEMFKTYSDKYTEGMKILKAKGSITARELKELEASLVEFIPTIKSPSGTDVQIYSREKLEGLFPTDFEFQTQFLNASDITTQAEMKRIVAAKAAGGVVPIHFIDGAIIGELLKSFQMTGIYDAGMFNIGDVDNATKMYNEAIMKISKEYNLLEEIIKATEVLEVSTEVLQDLKEASKVANTNREIIHSSDLNIQHFAMDGIAYKQESMSKPMSEDKIDSILQNTPNDVVNGVKRIKGKVRIEDMNAIMSVIKQFKEC